MGVAWRVQHAVRWPALLDARYGVRDNHRDDQAVDAQHARHDNLHRRSITSTRTAETVRVLVGHDERDLARRAPSTGSTHRHNALHHELRLADAECGNAHTGLSRAVRGTQIGEDEGKRRAHEPKQRRVHVVVLHLLDGQRRWHGSRPTEESLSHFLLGCEHAEDQLRLHVPRRNPPSSHYEVSGGPSSSTPFFASNPR